MSEYFVNGWEYYVVGARDAGLDNTFSKLVGYDGTDPIIGYGYIGSGYIPISHQEFEVENESEIYAIHQSIFPFPYREIIAVALDGSSETYEDRFYQDIWDGIYHDLTLYKYDRLGQSTSYSLAELSNGDRATWTSTHADDLYQPISTLSNGIDLEQLALTVTENNLISYPGNLDFPANGILIAQGFRRFEIPSNSIQIRFPRDASNNPLPSEKYLEFAFGGLPVPHMIVDSWYIKRRRKKYLVKITEVETAPLEKPCYFDLVNGYSLDKRKIPQSISLRSAIDRRVRLVFYRKNPYEKVKSLTSIDIADFSIKLKKDTDKIILVDGLVLGTLWISDPNVTIEPQSVGNNFYQLQQMIYDSGNVAALFSHWLTLYDAEVARLAALATAFDPAGKTLVSSIKFTATDGDLKLLAAFNNHWHNATLGNDIGADIDHPLFKPNNARTFDYHFKPQSDGSFGDLVMDSPRIVELHDRIEQIALALDSEKYSKNDIDPTLPRVSNLGWYINRVSEVLGIRVDANAKINHADEKNKYLPATLNNPTLQDDAYALNCWGRKGLAIPHLPTTYTNKGKATELFDVVHDIPQLMGAALRQLDISLSIQHGSEIRINGIDGKVQAYPNQLAVLLECLQRLETVKYNSERTLTTAIVTSNEVRGLYSGIGIPSTQKFMQLRDSVGKPYQLPYFSHQKNKPSIAQTLATVLVNQAVVNGVLMPKKQPEKARILNPFNHFKAEKQ
jgi:hypothetical protein